MDKESPQNEGRRHFLKTSTLFMASCATGGIFYKLLDLLKTFDPGRVYVPDELDEHISILRDFSKLEPARYYSSLKNKRVACRVCFRRCVVSEGKRGFCRNKVNHKGKYYSLVYGRPSAVQIDPIEKEPCYHIMPGIHMLCTGTAGCNNRCKFCHNWHLSQRSIDEMEFYELSPPKIVELAEKFKCRAMSFTYNEPTTFYELMYDTMAIARKKNFKLIFHTNGGMNTKPMEEILKFVDGVTVDLKGFTEKFYREVSSSRLKPVLRTLKTIKQKGVHLEVVNLVVTTLNDNLKDIRAMCEWIKKELSDDTPLHFTRFFPNYKLTKLPPTPISTLEKARQIAAQEVGLKFVYIGNVPGHKYNSTYCPKCGKTIIERTHFEVIKVKLKDGKCSFCDEKIPGVWS